LSFNLETIEFANDCDLTQETCTVYRPFSEKSAAEADEDAVENVSCFAPFFEAAFFAAESSE
jgi:hypothetical protein